MNEPNTFCSPLSPLKPLTDTAAVGQRPFRRLSITKKSSESSVPTGGSTGSYGTVLGSKPTHSRPLVFEASSTDPSPLTLIPVLDPDVAPIRISHAWKLPSQLFGSIQLTTPPFVISKSPLPFNLIEPLRNVSEPIWIRLPGPSTNTFELSAKVNSKVIGSKVVVNSPNPARSVEPPFTVSTESLPACSKRTKPASGTE